MWFRNELSSLAEVSLYVNSIFHLLQHHGKTKILNVYNFYGRHIVSLVAMLQSIAQENTKLAYVTIAKWESSELLFRFVQSAPATFHYCKASLAARWVGFSKGLVSHLRLYYTTMSSCRLVNAASAPVATTISSPDEVSEPPSGVFGIVFLL